jgi:hypothetical protein
MAESFINKTILLNNSPAFNHLGEEVELTGEYIIVEYLPIEPAAYIWSPCFVITQGDNVDPGIDWDETKDYSIDPDVVEAILNPEGHARRLAMELLLDQEEIARMESEGG